jgi:thiol-disulfide isomerase/thioredoxin
MSATQSMMMALGTSAPDFKLPDVLGSPISLEHYIDQPLLVVFMCNHCPYVKHIRSGFLLLVRQYQQKGVGIVGINSNDADAFPEDSPDKMLADSIKFAYSFPYLYDETQETAKAYRAACTPDFFLFTKDKKLFYRGQMDDSRPGNGVPVTGKDLRLALDAMLAGVPALTVQKPSIGCNIKWKPGNEPDYFSH